MRVEWDEDKNLANKAKHKLSFEEAQELFLSDVDYLELFDELHSDFEERFIAVGPVKRGIILVVWTERVDDTIRIISARPANKRETALFHSYAGKAND